jgi:hypothetical protein
MKKTTEIEQKKLILFAGINIYIGIFLAILLDTLCNKIEMIKLINTDFIINSCTHPIYINIGWITFIILIISTVVILMILAMFDYIIFTKGLDVIKIKEKKKVKNNVKQKL